MTSVKNRSIKGVITVPGDKSISHRAVMIGSLARGTSRVKGFSNGADCHTTIEAFRAMGIEITEKDSELTIKGQGIHGLSKPAGVLQMDNSGTTTRLLSGILAAQPFVTELSGDSSLNSRPMKRIITPLSLMGADIRSKNDNGCAPLIINGSRLHGITYDSPVASAQVKSCILLAGLYAQGETVVREPFLSRDHTERMLKGLGANLITEGVTSRIIPGNDLSAMDLVVPGDPSTAAFYIVGALIVPGSEVTIRNVSLNPTRTGFLNVLLRMGADIRIESVRTSCGEEYGDITTRYSELHSTTVTGEEVPSLIDEIPILAIAAAKAKGTTRFEEVKELKAKESDRILAITENLEKMGVSCYSDDNTLEVTGTEKFNGAHIDTKSDHRIAMSFAIAALCSDEEVTLSDRDCVRISCPDFYKVLDSLLR